MNIYSRILCLQICLWQDYSRTVESKRFKGQDMTLHPPPSPFRSAVPANLIYPLIRYFPIPGNSAALLITQPQRTSTLFVQARQESLEQMIASSWVLS